jgi:hypothetical protein
MARKPIPAQGVVAPARSTASVIDTFTVARPDPEAGAKAERLAQSLGVLGQAVAPEIRRRKAQQDEQDFETGKAAARTGVLADGTKIRKGEIPPTGSYWFMKGFNQERGYNKAIGIGTEIEKRWAELDPEIKNSTDPKAYNDWLTGQFSELSQDTQGLNDDVLVGISSGLAQVRQNMVAKQNAYMTDLVKEESQTQLGDSVSYEVEQFLSNGYEYGDDDTANRQFLNDQIAALGDKGYYRGVDPDEAKATVYTQVLALAQREGDPKLLDAIPKSMRNAAINQQIIEDKQGIKAYEYQQNEIARTQRLRQAEEAANYTYRTEIIPKLVDDPFYVFNREELTSYDNIEPGLGDRALTAARRLQDNTLSIDPRAEQVMVNTLTVIANKNAVLGNQNPDKALLGAIIEGKIKSPSAIKAVQQAIANAEMSSEYIQNPTITEGVKRIDNLFTDRAPGVFSQPRLRNEVIQTYENYVIAALADELSQRKDGERLYNRQLLDIQREGYNYIVENYGSFIGSTPNINLPNAPQPGQIKRDSSGVTYTIKP